MGFKFQEIISEHGFVVQHSSIYGFVLYELLVKHIFVDLKYRMLFEVKIHKKKDEIK